MKLATQICRYLIYLLGAFIIFMSVDCFGAESSPLMDTFWKKIACFLINSSPGVFLIVINFLLRKKELIMGIILLASAVGAVFLFKFYIEPLEKYITILTVLVPLITSGVLFVIARNRY